MDQWAAEVLERKAAEYLEAAAFLLAVRAVKTIDAGACDDPDLIETLVDRVVRSIRDGLIEEITFELAGPSRPQDGLTTATTSSVKIG